jgi:hypothetical protein
LPNSFFYCLWRKFAQRLQIRKSQYLTEEEELQQKLQDATLQIKGIEHLKNTELPETDMMLINYQEKNEFVEDCPFGNVVLSVLPPLTLVYTCTKLYSLWGNEYSISIRMVSSTDTTTPILSLPSSTI